VNDWTPVFLGIIAGAVLIMAAIQVGALIYGARLAQRMNRLADQVEREVRPLFTQLQTVGAEAARASTLASQQVERVDRLFADVSQRIEDTVATFQAAVLAPAREGIALATGLRALVAALRGLPTATGAHPVRSEEEDSLFIG
jgi:hypothetical protein